MVHIRSIKEGVKKVYVNLFPLEEALHDKPPQDEPAHKKKRVPPEFKTADTKDGGVYVPVYNQILHNANIHFFREFISLPLSWVHFLQ